MDGDYFLIEQLPATAYGQALFRWLRKEISLIEDKEEHSLKLCDDPIQEDFRFQLGSKIAFKKILKLPDEIKEQKRS